MPRTRSTSRPVGRPRRIIVPAPPTPPVPTLEMPSSLPPTAPEAALTTSSPTPAAPDKPEWLVKNVSEDSPIRLAALKIMAMRAAGVTDAEIAKALGLSPKTIPGYLYKAGKMGWLTFDDPKDSLEYQILNKVVRRLDEGLDNPDVNPKTGMPVKTMVALKVAEGTVFKRFTEPTGGTAVLTNISLHIEAAPTQAAAAEEVDGGVPSYIDAEVTHG